LGVISNHVALSITTESAKVQQAGFGTPMILSYKPSWVERVRSYESTDDMVTDGFLATDPEVQMATILFSQNPRPPLVKVGRCANKPTQRWAFTPVVTNSTKYQLKFNGELVEYTSDANATAAEIIGGLKTALDTEVTAQSRTLTTSDQTTYLRAVQNTAGHWDSFESPDTSKLAVAMDHADSGSGGIAADLAAINLEDPDWYFLLHPFNSSAMVIAIAAWVEANKKFFHAATQDSAVGTSATDDVMSLLQDANYKRTFPIYHPDNGAFADAGSTGVEAPKQPGSYTMKFKQIAGVAVVNLTTTQRNNILAKNGNVFETVADVNMIAEGTVSSGEFADNVRGDDWLEARMGERVFSELVNADKIAFTPQGAAIIEGLIRAQLREAVIVGHIREEFTVTVPVISEVSEVERGARRLRTFKFSASRAGAVHKVDILGQISV
jgi:hypothetical protein